MLSIKNDSEEDADLKDLPSFLHIITPAPTPDFDTMSELELKGHCKKLWKDNVDLTQQNQSYQLGMIKNEETFKSLIKKYEELKSKHAQQVLVIEQNHKLKDLLQTLTLENETLKNENQELKSKLEQYENRITSLETKIIDLESNIENLSARDAPITIREAMKMLERWICFETVGSSRRQFQKYFNLDKINNSTDPAVKQKLLLVLHKYNLNPDHLDTLAYLKDRSDFSAPSNRPQRISFDDWNSLIVETDDDNSNYDDEDGVSEIKKELLDALAKFAPPPGDETPWKLIDPVEKPVLKDCDLEIQTSFSKVIINKTQLQNVFPMD